MPSDGLTRAVFERTETRSFRRQDDGDLLRVPRGPPAGGTSLTQHHTASHSTDTTTQHRQHHTAPGQHYTACQHQVLDNTKDVYTKILVVPSSDDACFENVHPQLPASLDRELKSDRLVMLHECYTHVPLSHDIAAHKPLHHNTLACKLMPHAGYFYLLC
jgi:hypothetical protein